MTSLNHVKFSAFRLLFYIFQLFFFNSLFFLLYLWIENHYLNPKIKIASTLQPTFMVAYFFRIQNTKSLRAKKKKQCCYKENREIVLMFIDFIFILYYIIFF